MEEKNIDKIWTVDDYKKIIQNEKRITLPSGAVFVIRRLNGRDLFTKISFPFQSFSQLTETDNSVDKEKAEIMFNKKTAAEKEAMFSAIEKVVVLAVKTPALSLSDEPDKLQINNITDDDYNFLVKEIFDFSLSKINQQGSSFFRDEKQSSNT